MDPFQQNLADLQSALRALWPDRAVVYFDASSAGALGEGPVLTDEERGQLHRVATAIAAGRAAAVPDEEPIVPLSSDPTPSEAGK
jgi:hypothetical protein